MSNDPAPPASPKVDWPSAAIVIAILALVGYVLTVLPEERVDASITAIVFVLAALGLGGALRGPALPGGLGALLSSLTGRRSSSSRPPPPPRSDRDGSVGVELLEALVLAVIAIALFVLSLFSSGCGGALQAHATAAHVIGIAIDGAYDVAEAHAVEATEACVAAGDEACVRAVHASMVPVALGLSGLEVAWSTYVSAIEVVHLSGGSDALLEALRSAAARMLSAYSLLADAMTRVGVALPAVPPTVLALVGDAS